MHQQQPHPPRPSDPAVMGHNAAIQGYYPGVQSHAGGAGTPSMNQPPLPRQGGPIPLQHPPVVGNGHSASLAPQRPALQAQNNPPLQPQAMPSAPMDTLSSSMGGMSLREQPNAIRPGRSKRVYAPMAGVSGYPTPPSSNYQQPQPNPGTSAPTSSFQQQQQQQQPGYQQQQQPSTPPKPKPKIDPNQIPSPVEIQLQDEQIYQHEPYGTCSQSPLPLSTTPFHTIDQGNCNPRFLRTTLREFPYTPELDRDTHLPFGLVVQPLAPLHPNDQPIPLASVTNEDGPIRCTRCKAYINPGCQFIDGGRKFVCNLCGFTNGVPEDYFCHLDMSGQRMDLDQRPELRLGSVEFEVPKIYWNREPVPLRILFAVDVSYSAARSGMLETFCTTLQQILYSEKASLPAGARVGIMTFDTAVHFFNLSSTLDQAQMLVVPDVNDMFLPLSEDAIFVDPHASRQVIEGLLSNLPTLFAENRAQTAAFGSAIKGGMLSMQTTGGKVHVFQTILPTTGVGALKNRDNPALYGTNKEKQLLVPQDTLYSTIGKECVDLGICVDTWFFPMNAYVDVSTLGLLSALTGGESHYYANYNKSKDGLAFTNMLNHSLTREQGYNAALRVRCSNGFTIDEQYGNFFMRNNTDVELAGIDSDKAVAFTLRHDGKVDEGEAHLQCALLYTTSDGHRRVRIHNIRVPVTSNISNLFKQADLDTSMNVLAKQIISQAGKKLPQDMMTQLDGECVRILAAYRKHCASSASPGQLILPESFKVLPLYMLGLKKSAALRRDTTLSSDGRAHNLRRAKCMGVGTMARWLYPRMVPVHMYLLNDQSGIPLQRLSYDRLESNGVYLIEGPDATFVWIGRSTSVELLQGLFGKCDLSEVDIQLTQVPHLDNPLSQKFAALMEEKATKALRIVRQGLDDERDCMNALVEDATFNQLSYVDYLCMVHKQIQNEIEREKHETFVTNASYWAYRY